MITEAGESKICRVGSKLQDQMSRIWRQPWKQNFFFCKNPVPEGLQLVGWDQPQAEGQHTLYLRDAHANNSI